MGVSCVVPVMGGGSVTDEARNEQNGTSIPVERPAIGRQTT